MAFVRPRVPFAIPIASQATIFGPSIGDASTATAAGPSAARGPQDGRRHRWIHHFRRILRADRLTAQRRWGRTIAACLLLVMEVMEVLLLVLLVLLELLLLLRLLLLLLRQLLL